MKLLLDKENNIKNLTIGLLLCFFFLCSLTVSIHTSPSHLRKIVKSQTEKCNAVNVKTYNLNEIDIAKIAKIESKSIYAQRNPKKKQRNPASDEGREMMANNNYYQINEKA